MEPMVPDSADVGGLLPSMLRASVSLPKYYFVLIQMSGKQQRKDKASSSNEDDSQIPHIRSNDTGNTLACILPTLNRKLKLSVIIKKTPKPKPVKTLSKIVSEKEKPKEAPKGKSLLDTLLEACEQIKDEEEENINGENLNRN